MGYYFEDRLSMFAAVGLQVEGTLDTIVKRYVGQNPPHPITYRAYSKRGVQRVHDYRYHADFSQVFPNAKNEQYVYAWSKHWADGPAGLMFDATCFGPMVIYCNGQEVFRSNIFSERYADARHRVTIPHQAGWNHFVIRYKKTGAGFGGVFGSWLGKHPYCFMMPSAERDGQEGWIFTEPMDHELASLPGPGMTEKDTGIQWRPELAWDAKRLKMGQLQRIFGLEPETFAVGWTKASFLRRGTGDYILQGSHHGPIAIYLGDKQIFEAKSSGKIKVSIKVPFGIRDVMVRSACTGSDWDFDLSIEDSQGKVRLLSPCNIQGTDQTWMYIGPFKSSAKVDLRHLRDLNKVHPSVHGDTYWRLDAPDTWVRMYNDNALYGRWNYPLGVTLYGLLHSARAIGSKEAEQYVVNHIQRCADTFGYALWDRKQYGGATAVHHLLSSIDSLDDCGSFGSVFLEVGKDHPIKGSRVIADYVADYISNKQARLPDGTFYRKKLMHVLHENTMWADDLYMSVPFLCRYYQLTGDAKYIDDASGQFLGFKERLFIPKAKLMSHVYDFRRQMATGVPWGRGNGWTIFSLSELLAVLPKDHPNRPACLEMFRRIGGRFFRAAGRSGHVASGVDPCRRLSREFLYVDVCLRLRARDPIRLVRKARAIHPGRVQGLGRTQQDFHRQGWQRVWRLPRLRVFVHAGVLQERVVVEPERHARHRHRPAGRRRSPATEETSPIQGQECVLKMVLCTMNCRARSPQGFTPISPSNSGGQSRGLPVLQSNLGPDQKEPRP